MSDKTAFLVIAILLSISLLAVGIPWVIKYFKKDPGEIVAMDEAISTFPYPSQKFVEAMEEANRRSAAARAKKYEEYDRFVRMLEDDLNGLSVQIDGKLVTEEVRAYIETRLKVSAELVEMRRLRDQYGPMRIRPPLFTTERVTRA